MVQLGDLRVLDWKSCWSISWFCGRQIDYPIVYVDGDWSVRKFLCLFTGCASFVPVGFWLSEKGAGSPNVYFGIPGRFCVSFDAEKVHDFLPNVELRGK